MRSNELEQAVIDAARELRRKWTEKYIAYSDEALALADAIDALDRALDWRREHE